MSLSIEEIRSRFDPKFIQISHGLIISPECYIGTLYTDPYTNKVFYGVCTSCYSSDAQVRKKWRNIFLSRFRYTHRLSYCANSHGDLVYIAELHGFRKDM